MRHIFISYACSAQAQTGLVNQAGTGNTQRVKITYSNCTIIQAPGSGGPPPSNRSPFWRGLSRVGAYLSLVESLIIAGLGVLWAAAYWAAVWSGHLTYDSFLIHLRATLPVCWFQLSCAWLFYRWSKELWK